MKTGCERIGEMMQQISEAIGGINSAEKFLLAAVYKQLADVHYAMLDTSEKALCDKFIGMMETVAFCREEQVNGDD